MTTAGASPGEFLGAVPMFSTLSAELRAEMAAQASTVQVPAGEYLFHQGDHSDSLYVVLSGRLEVLIDHDAVVARSVVRAGVLGELGLLTESPRSASVRARRDSELLRLDRTALVALLTDVPAFAVGLSRALAGELEASRGLLADAGPTPATIAVISFTPSVDARGVADRLRTLLGAFGSVSLIDRPHEADGPQDDEPGSYGRLLDNHERVNDKVLLLADAAADPEAWTAFCVRQADHIVAVAGAETRTRAIADQELPAGGDLVVCGAPADGPLDEWVELLRPRAITIVPTGAPGRDDLAPMARRLAGRAVGIVLSGGGARGLAHIGVLEELLACGVTIDRVAGCSMGAIVGACFAAGMSPQEIAERANRMLVVVNPVSDYTVPLVSLVRGRKIAASLAALYGSLRIEHLERDFFCVSSDLYSGELHQHRRGPLIDAVYASACLPGIFPPQAINGRVVIDGGVLNNLPIELMAARGEGPVIAADVSGVATRGPAQRPSRYRRPRARRWASGLHQRLTGAEQGIPPLRETMMRTMLLGSIDTSEAAKRHADVIITPDTCGVSLFGFEQLERARESGRAAARAALDLPETARVLGVT